MNGTPSISIAVFGASGAGKTTLIDAFASDSPPRSTTTAGSHRQGLLEMDDCKYLCDIKETEGDKGSAVRPVHDAEAFLVLFDKSQSESLFNAQKQISVIAGVFQAVP